MMSEDRLRRLTSIGDHIIERIRITVSHRSQTRVSGCWVHLELEQPHAAWVADRRIVSAVGITRISKPSASILRRTIPCVEKCTSLRVPPADSLGEVILFGNPEYAIGVDRHSQRMRHAQLIICSDLRASGTADHTCELACRRRKYFDLVTASPVCDIDLAV